MAPHYLQLDAIPFYWMVTESEEAQAVKGFSRVLSGKFPRIDGSFFCPRRRFISKYPQAFTFRWAAFRHKRFLVKDPLMLFNTVWFERHFGARTVLVTRSAVGFVASIKAKGWTFDFTHLTSQPELMAGPLAHERDAIEAAAAHPPDLIDQGCLLWRVLNRHIHRLADEDPRRLLCRHEALCQDPYTGFRKLFDQLELTWTPRTEKFLQAGKRAAFDQPANGEALSDADFDALWRDRLSEEEISRVRQLTES